jgi:hypothetical protein
MQVHLNQFCHPERNLIFAEREDQMESKDPLDYVLYAALQGILTLRRTNFLDTPLGKTKTQGPSPPHTMTAHN